jgi:hypothetical protein
MAPMEERVKKHNETSPPPPANVSREPRSGSEDNPGTKHGGRRRGAGAKPIDIDLVLLRNLCRIQCTDAEIAAIVHVSERTIKRHKKRKEFRDAMDAGKAEGRVSVRRNLFKLSEQGNVAATIFLSKNLLGYKNAVELKTSDSSKDDAKKAMDDLRALYGLTDSPHPTTEDPQ